MICFINSVDDVNRPSLKVSKAEVSSVCTSQSDCAHHNMSSIHTYAFTYTFTEQTT